MSYYAMVVVVEADDLEESFERVTRPLVDEEILFVGEPWQVEPLNQNPDTPWCSVEEPEFGTLEAFDHHPEK